MTSSLQFYFTSILSIIMCFIIFFRIQCAFTDLKIELTHVNLQIQRTEELNNFSVSSTVKEKIANDTCAITVILSMTPGRLELIFMEVLKRWHSFGYCTHVIILYQHVNTTQYIQRQIATLSLYHTSYEMVPMQNMHKISLPGLSRYLAACEQRFINTTLIISDMDLIPLPLLKDYIQQRLRTSPPTTIGVDFVYPITMKYFMGTQLGKQPVSEDKYTRTPRFRSCYLMGKGHLFRRVFQIQNNVQSVVDLVASVYDERHISIAYSTVRRQDRTMIIQKKVEYYLKKGPDNSYDEILFGKMAVAQGNCTWNSTSLDYRTSRCLHFEQRSHQRYPMVGEFHVPFNCYKYPNNSIDIHASRKRNISTCIKQLT